jgi:hypothetical protein
MIYVLIHQIYSYIRFIYYRVHIHALGVSPTNAFGADVRSLKPSGFTFVLLPAEGMYVFMHIHLDIYRCIHTCINEYMIYTNIDIRFYVCIYVYGADMRSLKPSGFTFVLLPAEGLYVYT